MKGISQIDFIAALGIFLLVLAFTVGYLTDYTEPLKASTEINALKTRLDDVTSHVFSEKNKLSLNTMAYRFSLKLENNFDHLINKSHAVVFFPNELVKFDPNNLGYPGDIDSAAVYLNNISINHSVSNNIIVFAASIGVDEKKFFTIYYDDDSYFTKNYTSISAPNELNEYVYAPETVFLLQYTKISRLMSYDYSALKKYANGDVSISITDLDSEQTVQIGPRPPDRGNVLSSKKYSLFQDADAKIRRGEVLIYVW